MTSRLGTKLIYVVLICLAVCAARASAQMPPVENHAPHELIRNAAASEIVEKVEEIELPDWSIELPAPDFRSDYVRGINDQAAPDAAAPIEAENHSIARRRAPIFLDDDQADAEAEKLKAERFNWRAAIGQSLVFLAVQHGYSIAFQQKTRDAMRKGAFWRDYGNSVKAFHGWDDGGRFFTNYIAHPMQGAFTGFIYVQNDPKARKARFGASKDYWMTRLKALAWTTAWSTQFEIGLISQSSIGNVGLTGKQGWVDMVVTPTVGTGWLVAEDWLDRYLLPAIERRYQNFYVKIFARMLFNPTRNFSNLFRFKPPWHRDRPPAR